MAPLPVLNCSGCGACCLTMGYPRYWRAETGAWDDPCWDEIPDALRREIEQRVAEVDASEGPCLWLDPATRTCRHYEWRPQICRDFQLGGFHCIRLRLENGIES